MIHCQGRLVLVLRVLYLSLFFSFGGSSTGFKFSDTFFSLLKTLLLQASDALGSSEMYLQFFLVSAFSCSQFLPYSPALGSNRLAAARLMRLKEINNTLELMGQSPSLDRLFFCTSLENCWIQWCIVSCTYCCRSWRVARRNLGSSRLPTWTSNVQHSFILTDSSFPLFRPRHNRE